MLFSACRPSAEFELCHSLNNNDPNMENDNVGSKALKLNLCELIL